MRGRIAGGFVLALVLVLCASFCVTQLAEVDLHWHLLTGSRIVEEGRAPRADTYTFTSAGRPWVDLSWLFQAVVALAHRAGGWLALDALKIVLVAGAFLIASAIALARAGPGLAGALALASIVASQERFTLRPEAFSFLLLSVLLWILARRADRERVLVLVPPLMILWANVHALYAVGLGVLVLTLAGDYLDHLLRRRAGGRAPVLRALGAATGAAAAGTLLTPYGWRGWDLPRRLLFERIAGENLYARSIAEFQAPFSGFGTTAAIIAFAMLAIALLAAIPLAWRHARAADLLLLAAGLMLALLARRNIPLFTLILLGAGGPLLRGARDRIGSALTRFPIAAAGAAPARRLAVPALGVLSVLLLADVWSNRFFARDGTQRVLGRGEAPGHYPWEASEYVLRNPVPGEVLHDMSVGGFLEWRWYPERRAFIDGRLEVHDRSLFTDYLRLQQEPQRFEQVARRYGVGTVLWPLRRSADAAPLVRHLARDEGWLPVHIDPAAAIFVRRDGAPAGGTAPPRVDLGDPALGARMLEEIRRERLAAAGSDPLPGWLRRLLPLRAIPIPEVNAALFFGVIGSAGAAETLFRAALAQAPDEARLHYDLGIVLEEAGRVEEARVAYADAIAIAPAFVPARLALARRRLAEGDAEGALREWALVERRGALDARALEARGALLARRGRLDEAIADFREAVARDPRRVSLRTDLALLYVRRGMPQLASDEIRRARRIDPESCLPGVAEGRIMAVEGDLGGAEKALLEATGAGGAPCPEAPLALAAIYAATGRSDEALGAVREALSRGLPPAVLSSEPSLRILFGRREFRDLLPGEAEAGAEERREEP